MLVLPEELFIQHPSSLLSTKEKILKRTDSDFFLCSGVSQRRIALILGISRTTVVRKFLFLGAAAQKKIPVLNKARSKSEILEFDDLETSEHTKMKPLSVTLAVESKTRFIRGFRVSQMPAKGLLAALSRKKYGKSEQIIGPAEEKSFLRKLTSSCIPTR